MARGMATAHLSAWRAFLETHTRVTTRLAAELERETGLPLTWYDVLVQVQEAGGRPRMQELARRVLLSKSGVTRLVDRMAAAGLVAREPCPDDRRGAFVTLTAAGRARLRGAAPVHGRGIAEHFATALTEREAAALEAAMGKVLAGLE
ncbi:MAG: MarR family winged helix-turn-helix transcriptional regulator [Tepidiformaceae bacterium]